jgi:glycosyltransferase involved in cell wall biosynthesis
MKILIYTQNFFPDMGGLERNTFTLANTLTEFGHEVTVLTETLREHDTPFVFKTIRTHNRQQQIKAVQKADLVFMNGGLSLKICVAAFLLRKKYVPIYQTTELYFRENSEGFSAKIRAFFAKNAAMTVTVSRFAKDRLQQILPRHTTIALPNPIDAELEYIATQQKNGAISKTYDLLFAGRLIDGKGIFHLVEAVSQLKHHDLTLAFAGEGDHKNELLNFAQNHRVNMTYLGRLDREALIDTYLKSKVLVVPSSTHTEGNPLVIAEALSVGTPVIASNQGAMVEAVGNAGYVFERGQATDLAAKIDLLFSGNNLSEKTRLTQERKTEFSYPTYQNRLSEILKTLNVQ